MIERYQSTFAPRGFIESTPFILANYNFDTDEIVKSLKNVRDNTVHRNLGNRSSVMTLYDMYLFQKINYLMLFEIIGFDISRSWRLIQLVFRGYAEGE